MPAHLFEIITLIADFLMIVYVAYFFLWFKEREDELAKKEGKADTEYHQVVDNALNKERKIIEDATAEADKIISDAKFVNKDTSDKVNQALQVMVTNIQKDAAGAANNFLSDYQTTLSELSKQSLASYKGISAGLSEDLKKFSLELESALKSMAEGLSQDLQKQVKDFHDSLLPALNKELEEYKQLRIKQADQTITQIVQKVSQDLLNRSLTIPDHQALMVEALEKAKKDGVFD
jgi:hypothetical protein